MFNKKNFNYKSRKSSNSLLYFSKSKKKDSKINYSKNREDNN